MNPKENSELTVQALMTLRQESDAVRVITDQLKVKEMGPADHIRTKHEVKAFVESGSESVAATLLRRAAERLVVGQKLAKRVTVTRSQTI